MASADAAQTGGSFGADEATGYAAEFWNTVTLKRGILLFWAGWLSIVTLTNVFDGLKALGVLGSGWTFASGNYGFMLDVTSVHGTPAAVVGVMFAGVVVWELVGSALLWQAFASFGGARDGLRDVYRAFIVTLALFATFMLMTEVFLAYDVESTHMRIFIAQLVSVYAIHQLPE
jgi:hypothetical protein